MVPIAGLAVWLVWWGLLWCRGCVSVCSAVVVPLRLNRCERRRLWAMFAEQRQAFNFGVAATLEVLERDGKTGSRFDVWKTLTKARHTGMVAADVPLMCQRAGCLRVARR